MNEEESLCQDGVIKVKEITKVTEVSYKIFTLVHFSSFEVRLLVIVLHLSLSSASLSTQSGLSEEGAKKLNKVRKGLAEKTNAGRSRLNKWNAYMR